MKSDILACECFRSMVEASPAAMVMTDVAGKVRYVNAEAERMFGYGREELVGRSVDILVPARIRWRHPSLRRSFFLDPRTRPMGFAGRKLEGRRRDGTEFPVEIGLAPLETPSGLFVTAALVDLSERRAAEEALARGVEELERSNGRLLQFAYVASLDLQSPLLEIASQSRRLESAISSANRDEMLRASKAMRECALCARKLVDDLLIYARTIYGDQQLEILELREEVQFSLADLAQMIAATNAKVKVDVPPATFIADRRQFSRLMRNIVANAIKYRKPGGVAKVDITASLEDESILRLAIADNGVGFDEDFARRIFEPFERPRGKIEYAGTGIELAICKSIADRHGWNIAVKSHPGEGATFLFTIPTLFAIPELPED